MAISALLVYPALLLFFTVLGWPAMAYLNSRVKDAIADCVSFDASRKLDLLRMSIVPNLKQILWKVKKQKVMEAAREYSPNVEALDTMVKNLKSALCEAEDTLDLLEYHRLRKNADLHDWRSRGISFVGQKLRSCCMFLHINVDSWSYGTVDTIYQDDSGTDSFLSSISRWRFMAKWKLKNRIENMENIITDVHASPEYTSVTNDMAHTRIDIGSKARPKIFGRDKERDTIIEKLYGGLQVADEASSSNSPCYSVIGIHGIPGSGKTTLAQYVADCVEEFPVPEKNIRFDLVMRVHVPENFSLNSMYRDMLNKTSADQESDIQELQKELETKLNGKRFLLVLDDLCVKAKNYKQLDELLSPLNVGMRGSKILVTSRSEKIAGIQHHDDLIAISDLNQTEYLNMFMHYALDGIVANHEEYISIGKKIAEKLHSSPFAAALVAARLRTRDTNFWTTLAELDLLNEARGYLWWSYEQLGEEIRECFEYCSIFPRKFELELDELVRMWVAQGFIHASKPNEREAVAKIYVEELLACSFLQLNRKTPFAKYYTMHDLLHEFAKKVGGRDYFRIENGCTGIAPKDVMHLFIETYDGSMLSKQIVKLKRLPTLIIDLVKKETGVEEIVCERLFRSLPKLRVLSIRDIKITVDSKYRPLSLPACINHSKHLRYLALDLCCYNHITLPSSFSELYHMQLLEIGYCNELVFSGEDTANLINLRHIISRATTEIIIGGKRDICYPPQAGAYRKKESGRFQITKEGFQYLGMPEPVRSDADWNQRHMPWDSLEDFRLDSVTTEELIAPFKGEEIAHRDLGFTNIRKRPVLNL